MSIPVIQGGAITILCEVLITITLQNSNFSNNRATDLASVSNSVGGALFIIRSHPQQHTQDRIENCRFDGNKAGSSGAVAWHWNLHSVASVEVVGCTVTNNEATAGRGGGLLFQGGFE